MVNQGRYVSEPIISSKHLYIYLNEQFVAQDYQIVPFHIPFDTSIQINNQEMFKSNGTLAPPQYYEPSNSLGESNVFRFHSANDSHYGIYPLARSLPC